MRHRGIYCGSRSGRRLCRCSVLDRLQNGGSFTAVKNSATLDEVAQLLNPELAEGSKRIDGSSRARSKEQYARLAENLSQAVRHEADSGHKIEAVKLYMNESGESLMEAKKVVEAYLEQQPFNT